MNHSDLLKVESLSLEDIQAIMSGVFFDDMEDSDPVILPSPPMLMIDRVTGIYRNGNKGRIIAELDIRADAWYYACHFPGDPIHPGSLMLEGLWQLLVLFCAMGGARGSGRALGVGEVAFLKSTGPGKGNLRYELDILKFLFPDHNGNALAVADGTVYVEDVEICKVHHIKAGVFKR
jgi:3-hydroxyacyl-[acyl-carrier protein] dehydratase/trans-2-decenoyl-[acyl-carrier protein] isomerase